MVGGKSSQLRSRKRLLGERKDIRTNVADKYKYKPHNGRDRASMVPRMRYANFGFLVMLLSATAVSFKFFVLINNLDSENEKNFRGRRMRPARARRCRQIRLSDPELLIPREAFWASTLITDDLSKTEKSKTERSKTESSKTEKSKTEKSKTERSKAHENDAAYEISVRPALRSVELIERAWEEAEKDLPPPLWDDDENWEKRLSFSDKRYNSWVWEKRDLVSDDFRDSYYNIEEHGGKGPDCDFVEWHHSTFPSCNNMHEINMSNPDEQLISYGFYRNVWVGKSETYVIKSLVYNHEYGMENFEFVRMDALVMERLTSSPLVVDIYDHCGTTIVAEAVHHEIEEKMVPGDGVPPKEGLNDANDVKPRNKFNVTQKLTIALEMAESLADLHGFKDGVIVHDDVQPCQWLRTSDGVLKINDFNRAEIMLWNGNEGKYCRYYNGKVSGNYRAPEENQDHLLNEKIDIYSFGNNIYTLLTGLWNYYDYSDDDKLVQEMVNKNTLPFIDPRYKNHTFGEGVLVRLLERCFVYEPDDRADIFEIVHILRVAMREQLSLVAKKKEKNKIIINNKLAQIDKLMAAY